MLQTSKLKSFFEAIGELCTEWPHLEQWVNRLFLAIGGWNYTLPTTLVMSSRLDFRDQIAAAKIGAIIRCPSGDFLDNIIASLDYIDNDLRNARNRFIHDIWAPADDKLGAIRIDITAAPKKVPGSGARTVQTHQINYVRIEEVYEVTNDAIQERQYLAKIVQCFQYPEDTSLPSQLSERPPRLHLRRQQERQNQTDTSREVQKSPRKPSSR